MKNTELELVAALAVKTYEKDPSLRGLMEAKKLLDEFGTEVLNAGPEPLGVYCSILNRLVEFDVSKAKFAETMNNAFLYTHKTLCAIRTYLTCQIILREVGEISTLILEKRIWNLEAMITTSEYVVNTKDRVHLKSTTNFVRAAWRTLAEVEGEKLELLEQDQEMIEIIKRIVDTNTIMRKKMKNLWEQLENE